MTWVLVIMMYSRAGMIQGFETRALCETAGDTLVLAVLPKSLRPNFKCVRLRLKK